MITKRDLQAEIDLLKESKKLQREDLHNLAETITTAESDYAITKVQTEDAIEHIKSNIETIKRVQRQHKNDIAELRREVLKINKAVTRLREIVPDIPGVQMGILGGEDLEQAIEDAKKTEKTAKKAKKTDKLSV